MKTFLLLVLFISCIYTQNHQIYLRNDNSIPLYYQETDYWCGAASAQMSLAGYPNGVEHSYNQTSVWNTIQKHKVEKMWATDPAGLRGALNELGASASGQWQIFYWRKGYNPGPNLMYHAALWMTKLRYPVVATVYGHGHALVITGITTNVNPVSSNSVNVVSVEIHDPWPPSKGAYVQVSAATWYSRYFYPPQKDMGSAWDGCMLATIHCQQQQLQGTIDEKGVSPQQDISMEAPTLAISGTIISIENVEKIAQEINKHSHLFSEKYQETLTKSTFEKPILVNKSKKAYYLLPFSQDSFSANAGAIMINAYDGTLEAISVFNEPFRIMTEKEIQQNLRLDEDTQMEAIFEPSQQCRSPFTPVWKYDTARGSFYVDYEGKVFSSLTDLVK